ncbi:MAG TPA: U32 family peptidase [Desulfitobacteriaceae bacterium]|nr:U32 family peptidase [Desulfitobacteriaceae bacterium]
MNLELRTKCPELLAPAGGYEAFKAAVENGADAIYLGGKNFSARANAVNFDSAELRQAVRYAHERMVKVYVTVNILIADSEFKELIPYLYSLYEMGVDALILQDSGVVQMLKSVLPELELHASTQMTINNSWGVKHLEGLGFKRVVLARETSIAEIRALAAGTKLALEVFIHGALCISYSGQCLMSSFIGGRSGNRGMCAQPCRLKYQLIAEDNQNVLAKTNLGDHLLSTRDLNLAEQLMMLWEAGVSSFKIEGRMKRPEYVATVTRIYRKVLDRLEKRLISGDSGPGVITSEEKQDLTQIFNRDFTTGYLTENQGKELMSYSRPNNRGIRLGRITEIDKRILTLKLEASLRIGDGIEIWTRLGREGFTIEKIYNEQGEIPEGRKGETVKIPFAGQAGTGDRIFKTSDLNLLAKARLSFQEGKEQRKRALKMKLSGAEGKKICLEVWDRQNSVKILSTNPAQKALKKPLTEEYVRQQLSRLGTTPFFLQELELELEGEIMIPVSDLNEMRRKAVESLLEGISAKPLITRSQYNLRVEQWQDTLSQTRADFRTDSKPQLSVAVFDQEALQSALGAGAQKILFGGETWRSHKNKGLDVAEAYQTCRSKGAKGVWYLPRILNEDQGKNLFRQLAGLAESVERPVVMVANLGQLEILHELDKQWPFEVDYSLNVFNQASLAYFISQGARQVTLSAELNHEQVRNLAGWAGLEIMVFGDLEMMVSEHCPIGSTLGGKKAKSCSQPCAGKSFSLKDRLNYQFPIETDRQCRMHLFNVKRLNLYQELGLIKEMGIKTVRLQLSRHTPRQVKQVVSVFNQAWQQLWLGSKADVFAYEEGKAVLETLFPDGYTKGHFFRGVI